MYGFVRCLRLDGMSFSHPNDSGQAPAQRTFASALAQPTFAAPLGQPTSAVHHLPVAVPAAPIHAKNTTLIVLFLGLGSLLLALIAYFLVALGAIASIIGLILALIPLTIVLLGVRYIDRWEPEPKRLVFFALAWGALASVGIALLVDLGLYLAFGGLPAEFGIVLQAPIVEEVAKGFGILLIFLIARSAFDGPVDGVVYGALIGAGFAFTENIQYFAVSFIEGGGSELTATFIVRGIFSPFAHAMFTALTGYCIGLVARRGGTASQALGMGSLGLLGAIFLHAFWNGSALYADFFLLYITLQVPLFVGFILAIVALRKEEARLTHERLGEYAAAGWFTPEEVNMLATGPGRKAGLAWAAGLRGNRTAIMKGFIRDATALAAVRQRAIAGRDPRTAEQERVLLARTTAARAALLAL